MRWQGQEGWINRISIEKVDGPMPPPSPAAPAAAPVTVAPAAFCTSWRAPSYFHFGLIALNQLPTVKVGVIGSGGTPSILPDS